MISSVMIRALIRATETAVIVHNGDTHTCAHTKGRTSKQDHTF